MSRRLAAFGLSFLLTPLLGWIVADEKVTLAIPGVQ